MLAAAIGIALIIGYYLLRAIYQLNRDPKKDRATFLNHVAEIRGLINRCGSMAEWWALEREIDWLDDTWKGRIDNALLIQETGKLYDQWFKKRADFPAPNLKLKTA